MLVTFQTLGGGLTALRPRAQIKGQLALILKQPAA